MDYDDFDGGVGGDRADSAEKYELEDEFGRTPPR